MKLGALRYVCYDRAVRICLDLDGVICELRQPGDSYADLQPVNGAVEAIRRLRRDGHYIIIFTARHMATTGGNLGQVLARQGEITLRWLSEHGVEYDEILFGKPFADIYIDDNGFRFRSWDDALLRTHALPQSSESKVLEFE